MWKREIEMRESSRSTIQSTIRRAVNDYEAMFPRHLDGNDILLELDDKVIPGDIFDTVAGPIDDHVFHRK
jgi:hypothetical protein